MKKFKQGSFSDIINQRNQTISGAFNTFSDTSLENLRKNLAQQLAFLQASKANEDAERAGMATQRAEAAQEAGVASVGGGLEATKNWAKTYLKPSNQFLANYTNLLQQNTAAENALAKEGLNIKQDAADQLMGGQLKDYERELNKPSWLAQGLGLLGGLSGSMLGVGNLVGTATNLGQSLGFFKLKISNGKAKKKLPSGKAKKKLPSDLEKTLRSCNLQNKSWRAA